MHLHGVPTPFFLVSIVTQGLHWWMLTLITNIYGDPGVYRHYDNVDDQQELTCLNTNRDSERLKPYVSPEIKPNVATVGRLLLLLHIWISCQILSSSDLRPGLCKNNTLRSLYANSKAYKSGFWPGGRGERLCAAATALHRATIFFSSSVVALNVQPRELLLWLIRPVPSRSLASL